MSGHPSQVGPYPILGLLGEGGMGRVYLGYQKSADKRPVAIKMLRTSLPVSEMARRFELERQALSRLNHPAIAQLYGAGHAEDGRHFVAMEYVEGLSITRYCDRKRLGIRARLELFVAICRGVEHAHRRQLLHRDLKPSNLMVTIQDGEPVPKIIDFGIARTLEVDENMTAFTGTSILGTPAYMSPEAVGPTDGPRDLDTRTDVYSLGVVLYELLVGLRPHESRTKTDPLAVIHRVLHEEIVRPSKRWRTLELDERTESAETRDLAEATLARRLSGDLDWITMKALAKDREQRYGSVAELAADIERHLRDEPVQAGPPTWRYRVGKFVRRRRWLVATSALALLAIIGGIVGTGIGLVRARDAARAEALAVQDAKSSVEFVFDLFRASRMDDRGTLRSPDEITVRDLLEAAKATVEQEREGQPEIGARTRRIIAESYRGLGLYQDSLELLESARAVLAPLPLSPNVRNESSRVELAIGRDLLTLARPEEAIEALDQAETLLSKSTIRDRLSVLSSTLSLKGNALRSLARFDEAEAKHREALALIAELPGAEDQVLSLRSSLGKTFFQQGRWSEAEIQYKKSADLARETLGPAHMRTATTLDNLAASIASQGRPDEAMPLFLEALEMRRSLLRSDHPILAFSLHNLGATALDQGHPEEAESFHREALAIRLAAYGEKNPRTAWSHDGLGSALLDLGRLDEALEHLETALETRRATLGAEHPHIRRSLRLLGELHRAAGNLRGAAGRFREALDAGPPREHGSSEPDPNGAEIAVELAEVLAELGLTDESVEIVSQAEARLAEDQKDELGSRLEALRNSLDHPSLRDSR